MIRNDFKVNQKRNFTIKPKLVNKTLVHFTKIGVPLRKEFTLKSGTVFYFRSTLIAMSILITRK